MMIKQVGLRAFCSFCVTGMVNVFIMLIMAFAWQSYYYTPFLPDYLAHFSSETIAVCVEILLIAFIGAVFGGCSVIYDMEKWSFIKQGIVHFAITTIVWFPITMFIWNAFKYPSAGISIMCSYSIVYIITWVMSGIKYKKQIADINEELKKRL